LFQYSAFFQLLHCHAIEQCTMLDADVCSGGRDKSRAWKTNVERG